MDQYIQYLAIGTPLDPNPSREEQAKKARDETYLQEVRRLATEEAREEAKLRREAKKASQAQNK